MVTNVFPMQRVFDLSDPTSLTLDLENPKPKEVHALIEALEADMKEARELGALPVKTGWEEITPAIAVNLARRNRPGANRKVDASTVFYYASQMARGQWKATGQPILIDDQEHLIDGQHRLLAVLISGVTLTSFVTTGIKHIPNLFAYIDNARPRTPATALQTAGFNGVAPIIVKIIRMAEEVRHGVYNPSGATKLQRLSPIDTLTLIEAYPNARQAARSVASDWAPVAEFLGKRKDVVAYFGMRVTDLHGEDTADDFFEEIMDPRDRSADDPIGAFRKVIEKDIRAERPMKKQHALAALIRTFNAWKRGEALPKRWMLEVNEDFPRFDENLAEAA